MDLLLNFKQIQSGLLSIALAAQKKCLAVSAKHALEHHDGGPD